jgi:hypothetical protein
MLHYDNYEKLEDILREHLFSLSVIGGVRVSVCGPCCSFRFCVVLCFCVLFVFILCPVYPILYCQCF